MSTYETTIAITITVGGGRYKQCDTCDLASGDATCGAFGKFTDGNRLDECHAAEDAFDNALLDAQDAVTKR